MKQIKRLAFVILLLPAVALAGNGKQSENWSMVQLEKHQIESDFLERDIRLQVGLPDGYGNTDNSYGVLYYLDGFTMSGSINDLVALLNWGEEIPKLITVGIELDVNNVDEWYKERSYILTPSKSDIYEEFGIMASWCGGGPQFLKSIEKEVIPFIEQNYRVIKGDRTLVGHSFGGLFALYTLFENPSLFKRYLSSSPSLPWDDRVIFKMESGYSKKNSDLPAKLFLSVGSLETYPEDMVVHHLKELAAILELRNYGGLELTSVVFEDESHTSVRPASFSRGLRTLYSAEIKKDR